MKNRVNERTELSTTMHIDKRNSIYLYVVISRMIIMVSSRAMRKPNSRSLLVLMNRTEEKSIVW